MSTDLADPADTAEFTSESSLGAYRATFEYTRNLIAALPTFREVILGVHSEDEAKARIYKQETLAGEDDQATPAREGDPPPEYEPRPYAVILDGKRSRRRSGIGEWFGEGTVAVVFEALVPSEFLPEAGDGSDVIRDKFRRLRNWGINLASMIEDEILELSGSSDAEGNPFLNVVDCELLQPPADPADDIIDKPYIGFVHELTWR